MAKLLQFASLLPLWFLSLTYSFVIVPVLLTFTNLQTFLTILPFFFLQGPTPSSTLMIYLCQQQTTKACSHFTLAFNNLVTLKSVASNRLVVEKCFPTSISNYITFIFYFFCPWAPIFYYHYPYT